MHLPRAPDLPVEGGTHHATLRLAAASEGHQRRISRGAPRRPAMIIAALVMLCSISLYVGVQVEDLLS
jgi:hypothetical protein